MERNFTNLFLEHFGRLHRQAVKAALLPPQCPICRHEVQGKADLAFFASSGYCLACDHIAGDTE